MAAAIVVMLAMLLVASRPEVAAGAAAIGLILLPVKLTGSLGVQALGLWCIPLFALAVAGVARRKVACNGDQ